MKRAVIYARVSSAEQREEGFSIPAQLKLLREYARSKGFRVDREFTEAESAKKAGRRQFGEMIRFLQREPGCRVVLVEKTDRLTRNFRDFVTLEDLEIELHLVKEAKVFSKNSKSQDRLVQGLLLRVTQP